MCSLSPLSRFGFQAGPLVRMIPRLGARRRSPTPTPPRLQPPRSRYRWQRVGPGAPARITSRVRSRAPVLALQQRHSGQRSSAILETRRARLPSKPIIQTWKLRRTALLQATKSPQMPFVLTSFSLSLALRRLSRKRRDALCDPCLSVRNPSRVQGYPAVTTSSPCITGLWTTQ